MRVIFDEELKAVADDLDRMVQDVRKAINGAGDALLKQDVEAAQSVIDGDIEIDALESSVIDQCIRLLAKQNPVATDLRVVVSTLRLAATFERMGDLAKHIAEAARRIYPEPALPAEATELFTEMQQFLSMTADRIVVMLQDRDAKTSRGDHPRRRQARRAAPQDLRPGSVRQVDRQPSAADRRRAARPLHGASWRPRRVGLPPRRVHRVRLRSEQGAVARRGRRRRVTTTAAMPSPAFRHN